MADVRLQRLWNLAGILAQTRTPLTLRDINEKLRLAGSELVYPLDGDGAAGRRAFERDKADLERHGIRITRHPMPDGGTGYRILPEDFQLPDLGLTPEEATALNLAVNASRGPGGGDLALKLGGITDAPVAVSLAPVPAPLEAVLDAQARRRRIRFGYRDRTGTPSVRVVDPWAVVSRQRYWYLVGWDVDRDGRRVFRVDRFTGPPEVEGPMGHPPPGGFDPRGVLPADPKELEIDEPAEAEVRVDAELAPVVETQLGADAVVERHGDGAVTVRVRVGFRDAFRSWVLGLGHHAEVVAPAELRADLVRWLERTATGEVR